MKTYLRDELVRFLKGVDAALTRATDIVIIGGAAASVHYKFSGGTRDIDTWTSVDQDLARAVQRAHETTGIGVPLEHSGVADGPYDFESRLKRTLPTLKKLKIFVPEKHDLALMKVLRGDEHDLEAIEGIHRLSALDADVLLQRYLEEMGAVVGEPSRIRSNFLSMIERLFPERASAVAKQVPRR